MGADLWLRGFNRDSDMSYRYGLGSLVLVGLWESHGQGEAETAEAV